MFSMSQAVDTEIIDLREPQTGDTAEPLAFEVLYEHLAPSLDDLSQGWDEVRLSIDDASSESRCKRLAREIASFALAEINIPGVSLRKPAGDYPILQKLVRAAGLQARVTARAEVFGDDPDSHHLITGFSDVPPEFSDMPGVRELAELVTTINSDLVPVFVEIEQTTQAIQADVVEYLGQSPEHVLKLSKWAVDKAECSIPNKPERTLLDTLALDTLDQPSSGINLVVTEFAEQAQAGNLTGEFLLEDYLVALLNERESAEQIRPWLDFARGLLQKAGIQAEDDHQLLLNNRNNWPATLEERYRQFCARSLEIAKSELFAVLNSFRPKIKSIPTNEALRQSLGYSAGINLITSNGKTTTSRGKSNHKGRVTPKSTRIDNVFVGNGDQEPDKKACLAVLVDFGDERGHSYNAEPDAVERFVAKQIEKIGRKCGEDVTAMIKAIAENPYRFGQKKIDVMRKIRVGDKVRPMRSFQMKGLSESGRQDSASIDLRILYAVFPPAESDGQPIVVIDGIYKHDDYERRIANA